MYKDSVIFQKQAIQKDIKAIPLSNECFIRITEPLLISSEI